MKMKRPKITAARLRRTATYLVILGVLGAGAFNFNKLRGVQDQEELPSAPARKGDFSAIVRCRGELKARNSRQVIAPKNVPELRILWLANQGSNVKEGDVVFRFDPSSAKQQLQEKEATLQQAQAALDQAIATSRIGIEQDKLETASASYQVEKAKLEASKAEIVSRLQGEESRVDLGLAETKLDVQRANANLNKALNEAKIAALVRARDKAKDEVTLTKYRLDQMEVRPRVAGCSTCSRTLLKAG